MIYFKYKLPWVSVDDFLPESLLDVIVSISYSDGLEDIAVGHYIERFSVESDYKDNCADEYCEEDDTDYYLEGWYLKSFDGSEFESWALEDHEKVIAWMPKPKLERNKMPENSISITKEGEEVVISVKASSVHSSIIESQELRLTPALAGELTDALLGYLSDFQIRKN